MAGDGGRRKATRVVLSYPADLSVHGKRRIDQPQFRRYLRRAHGSARAGDRWDEFTDIGCCGNQRSVPLRVVSVDGGAELGQETTIEYVERAACGLEGGWAVQGDEPDAV